LCHLDWNPVPVKMEQEYILAITKLCFEKHNSIVRLMRLDNVIYPFQ